MLKNLNINVKTFFFVIAVTVVPFLALTFLLCNLAFAQVRQKAKN